jgi:transcription antitermination factor NusA-like protein
MEKTFDMQSMRQMNLFTKISRVQAKHCFYYNNMLLFVVPKMRVQQAIGKDNSNLQKISQILKKRIRIVAEPKAKTQDAIKEFIQTIISPVEFNAFELKPAEIIITAGRESKARLIGRARIRQKELQDVIDQYFGIKKLTIA